MKKIALYSFIIFLLDLLSKFLIVKFLHSDLNILGNFFKFSYAENFGIAFSLKIPFILIFLLNSLVLTLFIVFIKKELLLEKNITAISCSMIIGGGLGNLIDRAYNGFVIDFISIFTYPTFNLADIFISLGVLFLLVFYAKISRTSK